MLTRFTDNKGPLQRGKRTSINGDRPKIRQFSGLINTTALVAATIYFGVAHSSPAKAEPTDQAPTDGTCATGAGVQYYGHQELDTKDLEIDVKVAACHEAPSGQAYVSGVWTDDLDETVNSLTVRGTIKVDAIAADGIATRADAEARGIHTDEWNGETNVLTNYATITSTSNSNTNPALVNAGVSKAFGIFSNDWEGTKNYLYNYGDIFSTAIGGTLPSNAVEAHGIRTGEWNGDYNYLENWGDITLHGSSIDGRTTAGSDADTANGGISNQGMNGAQNILLNFGDIYVEGQAGDDAARDAIATARGINVANFESYGEEIIVKNWGDLTIRAFGGDDAGRYSYTTAAGIEHQGSELNNSGVSLTKKLTIENWGNMDIRAINGVGPGAGSDPWAYGIWNYRLGATEEGLLANYGNMNIYGESDDNRVTARVYGLAFNWANAKNSVINTGSIFVEAADPNARAVGMGNWGAGKFDGYMYNEGKIVARTSDETETADRGAFAIRLGSVSDVLDPADNFPTLELSTLGFLEGRIQTGGQEIIVDAETGHSVFWTVEDTEGAPKWGQENGDVFYAADGLSAATYDTTMISSQNAIVSNLLLQGKEQEANRFSSAGSWNVWASGLGGDVSLVGEDRSSLGSNTAYRGLVAGVTGSLGSGNGTPEISFSFGALEGDTGIDTPWMESSSADVQSQFAGVSLALGNDVWNGNIGYRAGKTEFDHKRNINNNLLFGGTETTTGSQSVESTMFSAELGRKIKVDENQTVSFVIGVDHVESQHGAYAETGTAKTMATIGAYETSTTRTKAGVRWLSHINDRTKLLAGLYLYGDREGGDNTASVTMLTETKELAVKKSDANGALIALGISHQIGGGNVGAMVNITTNGGHASWGVDLTAGFSF